MLPPWMVPNVLAAALAVATSYFVHVHDTSHHRHHRLLAMDVVFDAMTPCGENGRFCRERVFGDGDDADAATRPCFQARLAVEKSVFGQEESTEMVLDAICDAFREMDHAEEEDENEKEEEQKEKSKNHSQRFGNNQDLEIRKNIILGMGA